MAPMYRTFPKSRQIDIILPPRPANGMPAPVESVSRRISGKVFFSLLAGTLCIFFLAVFCWKIGRVFRAFNRDKVLKGGKTATVQYAKTWHGWTELTKHEERRQRRKDFYKRFRQCLSWKSTHADYSWVYWDPGNQEINRHYENQKGIRWLPRWLLSYDFHIAHTAQIDDDSAVNHDLRPGSDAIHKGKQKETCVSDGNAPVLIPSGEKRPWGLDGRRDASTLRRRRRASPRLRSPLDSITASAEVRESSQPRPGPRPEEPPTSSARGVTPGGIAGFQPGVFHSPISSPRKRSSSMPSASSASHDQSFFTSVSRQLSVVEDLGANERRATDAPFPARVSNIISFSLPNGSQLTAKDKCKSGNDGKSLSWKYKAWGARMQLDTFDQTRGFLGYAGRPGSPTSDVLKRALSSGQETETSASFPVTHQATNRISASTSTRDFGSSAVTERDSITGHELGAYLTTKGAVSNINRNPTREYFTPCTDKNGAAGQSQNFNTAHAVDGPSSPLHRVSRSTSSESLGSARKTAEKSRPSSSKSRLSQRRLSSPEVRLVYNLGRRLEWLSNELDPGRKPFHFPMLVNHWLNKKTWFVLDPASRVPETSKRLHGDPRAIRSMADYYMPPKKVKYPNVSRGRAHTPKIDSWRLSVNRARRSSGMREFLRSIQLFDSSAEEPPDNAIDTASWVMRKPPQGFGMSTKQKTAYYNNGTGWYETLTDWQKVERAYRVRKMVHEGRANRTRVKEIAMGIGGVYQRAARRFAPEWQAFSLGRESSRLERQERSGSGSIPFGGQRGIFRGSGPHEQNHLTPATPDEVYPAQIPCPTFVTGVGMGSAEAGPEVVSCESREQRDAG